VTFAKPRCPPVLVVQGCDDHAGPKAAPVAAQTPTFVLEAASALRHVQFVRRITGRELLIRVEELKATSDHFRFVVALQSARTLIPGKDAALRVEQEDCVVGNRLHKPSEVSVRDGRDFVARNAVDREDSRHQRNDTPAGTPRRTGTAPLAQRAIRPRLSAPCHRMEARPGCLSVTGSSHRERALAVRPSPVPANVRCRPEADIDAVRTRVLRLATGTPRRGRRLRRALRE